MPNRKVTLKRKYNTVGGGSRTNVNGLEFERGTELSEAFQDHKLYIVEGDDIIDKELKLKVGTLYSKNKLYKNLLERNGINYKEILSKKLIPDDAVVIGKTLYIIEKKFQGGSGSVDEKLQTCDFKKRQYQKLVTPLELKVEYYYLLNDWFDKPSYRDVLAYIEEVGCRYFFKEIPLHALGL